MNRPKLALAIACIAFAASAQAAPPTHEHHAAAVAPGQAPAQRWATDAPLREGMVRVNAALEELRHYEMGHMTPAMARERAVAIEDAITYMFAHCKLDADADAALHGILVPLLTAAQRLDKDPRDLTAIAAMRDAVAAYPQRFDDPQWPSGAAPAESAGPSH